MLCLNNIALGKISYGAGYLQYAVVGPGAQPQLLDSYFQKLIGSFCHLAVLPDLPGLHTGVAVDFLSCKTLMLNLPRSVHSLSDLV